MECYRLARITINLSENRYRKFHAKELSRCYYMCQRRLRIRPCSAVRQSGGNCNSIVLPMLEPYFGIINVGGTPVTFLLASKSSVSSEVAPVV